MPDNNDFHFLLFGTIHDVLKADKLLKAEGFAFELVPVPRNLSSDCGMCIRLESSIDDALACLAHIRVERCFRFDGTDYTEGRCLSLHQGKE